MIGLLALGLLVAGRLLGVFELFIVGTALAALLVLSAVLVALTRIRLEVARELYPPRVHAGSPSRVDVRVTNHGGRSSPVLALRDGVSGTGGAHLMLGPLEPGETTHAAYRLPTEKRGILTIGPLQIVLTDPFGLARVALVGAGESELTVYPRVDTVAAVPHTTGDDPHAGAEHPNTLGRSGEDFYALRRYVVGDDLRRVHWPATARHDDLMVRQDELPWQGRATVLLDVRAATVPPAALESAVSAAASVVMASWRRQDLVRLVSTDGADSGFATGHAQMEAILEHLATVEPTVDNEFRRVGERLGRSSIGGALVAIVSEMPQAELDALARLRTRFGSLTVVQLHRSSWDPSADEPTGGGASSSFLQVTRSRPFAASWNRTMRPPGGQALALPGHQGRRGDRRPVTP